MKQELNLEAILKDMYDDVCLWNYMNPVEPNSLDDQYNLGYKSAIEDMLNIIKLSKK